MTIEYKGLPVHYSISGKGSPIILLHGFNETSEIWDSLTPAITEHYRCIAVDLPGFGKSPLPEGLTIPYMAGAVYRIVEELALVKPIVIGHSMGGYVTLELVNNHPGSFMGAGLFHSTAYADSEEKRQGRIKTLEFLDNNPVEAFLKVFIQGLFAPHNNTPGMAEKVESMVFQTDKSSVKAAIKAMMERPDRTEALKKNNTPWLFIAGMYDQLLPPEQMALQASFCQRAMFEILPGSGHLGMVEEPEISSEIILKFVDWAMKFNQDGYL